MMDPRVEEWLIDRELARQRGHDLTPEELCADAPELLPELKRQIALLEESAWLFNESALPGDSNTDSPPPTLGKSTRTLEEFVAAMRTSGLLSDSELAAVQSQQPVSSGESAMSLARQLVDDGTLTAFQANVLLGNRECQLVLDRYVIQDMVGAGGMGVVYKALHQSMQRIVALKVLPDHAFDSPEKVERFRREIKVAAQLNHPHIVTAYDAHESHGQHFLVMEFVEGRNLWEVVGERGPLKMDEAIEVVAQIAEALQQAHAQGIIHRDIKPSNILLTDDGGAKLLDLGLARITRVSPSDRQSRGNLTEEGIPMGTVAYMAPEQALNPQSATVQSDIYGLGCTLYYLLTGRPPFDLPSPVQVLVAHREATIPVLSDAEGRPLPVERCLRRMVARNPAERFASMSEVAQCLRGLHDSSKQASVANEPAAQAEIVPVQVVDRSRRWWLPAGGVVAVAAVVLLITGLLAGWFRGDPPPTRGTTDPRDLAKWVLNNGGMLSANTELGTQDFYEVAALPAGDFEITHIDLPDSAEQIPLESLAKLPNLQSLSFYGGDANDYDLRHLEEFAALHSLMFVETWLDATHLQTLGKLNRLQVLGLHNNGLQDDASLRSLAELSELHTLSLLDNSFGDEAIEFLTTLDALVNLDLEGTNISGEGLNTLAAFPQLEQLDLTATAIRDDDLSSLAQLSSLQVLILDHCPISGSNLGQLASLPMLMELHMTGTDVGNEALAELARQLPHLITLDIASTRVDSAGLSALAGFQQLENLSLASLRLNDRELHAISRLDSLIELNVSGNPLTDAALDHLHRLDLLFLDISDTRISTGAVSQFLADNPDCDVLVNE